eukprot:7134633-Ditylum_brightwellii.AAC.1
MKHHDLVCQLKVKSYTGFRESWGVSKREQVIMSFNAGLGLRYPQAFCHRHKLQSNDSPVTTEGEIELNSIIDQIQSIYFEEQCSRHDDDILLLKLKPVIIVDNYFSTDNICE